MMLLAEVVSLPLMNCSREKVYYSKCEHKKDVETDVYR